MDRNELTAFFIPNMMSTEPFNALLKIIPGGVIS
jgi:hypothetical protein